MAVPTATILPRGDRRATFVAHPMPRVTLPLEARTRGRRRAAATPIPLAARIGLVTYLAGVGLALAWGMAEIGGDILAVVAAFAILTAVSVLAAFATYRTVR